MEISLKSNEKEEKKVQNKKNTPLNWFEKKNETIATTKDSSCNNQQCLGNCRNTYLCMRRNVLIYKFFMSLKRQK